jgi:hypothetical protein
MQVFVVLFISVFVTACSLRGKELVPLLLFNSLWVGATNPGFSSV